MPADDGTGRESAAQVRTPAVCRNAAGTAADMLRAMPARHLDRPRFVRHVVCAAMLASASAAFAQPAPVPDPVDRLLADQGLAPEPSVAAPAAPAAAGSVFARKVRDAASDMVLTAMNFLGVRYRRGGNDVDGGFDCSGFTRHVFETSLGLVLPRRADEQATAPGLRAVQRDELRPGDLVFFNTLRRTFSHVGIYIGDGRFIHSPRPGSEVRVESIGLGYWARRFTGARRADAAALSSNGAAADGLPELATR